MNSIPHSPSGTELQAVFVAVILPKVEQLARVYFRDLKCAGRKEDACAEVLAMAWKWFVRLAQRGKDATKYSTVLATFAARAVRCGRRLCGQERAKDVLSSRAQRNYGFVVEQLPEDGSQEVQVFDQALQDNAQTPVPDQVTFRIDFPRWRKTWPQRDRRVIDDLMVGERTMDLAVKHHLSPARISQLRSEYRNDWDTFCRDPQEDADGLEPVVAGVGPGKQTEWQE